MRLTFQLSYVRYNPSKNAPKKLTFATEFELAISEEFHRFLRFVFYCQIPFCILVGAQNIPPSPHSPSIDAWRWYTRVCTELRVFEVSKLAFHDAYRRDASATDCTE